MAKRNLPFGGAVPMEPGERDRLVTVQALTDGTGTSGFPTETPATLAQVWMRKLDAGGRERFAAQQLSSPYDTQWEMGYRADMDPELVDVTKSFQLLYQGQVFDIVHASQIGRRDGIELLTLARPRRS